MYGFTVTIQQTFTYSILLSEFVLSSFEIGKVHLILQLFKLE